MAAYTAGRNASTGSPRVVDIEDGVVVVFEVVAVDGDIAGADEAGAAVGELLSSC